MTLGFALATPTHGLNKILYFALFAISSSCFRATESSKFVGSLFREKLWSEHGVKLHGHHIGAHFFCTGC